jgi:hypothetical protein
VRIDIDDILTRESQERQAAHRARSPEARDAHYMLAERYADRAWTLNEASSDSGYIPSGLWP